MTRRWRLADLIATMIVRLAVRLVVLTLGLFLLVVNAALLGITVALTSHLTVDSPLRMGP